MARHSLSVTAVPGVEADDDVLDVPGLRGGAPHPLIGSQVVGDLLDLFPARVVGGEGGAGDGALVLVQVAVLAGAPPEQVADQPAGVRRGADDLDDHDSRSASWSTVASCRLICATATIHPVGSNPAVWALRAS